MLGTIWKLLTNICVMKLKSKDVQKQSLWLLVLFAVFFACRSMFNSDWKTDVHEHVTQMPCLSTINLESTLKNAINHYTVIHFLLICCRFYSKGYTAMAGCNIFRFLGNFRALAQILNKESLGLIIRRYSV